MITERAAASLQNVFVPSKTSPNNCVACRQHVTNLCDTPLTQTHHTQRQQNVLSADVSSNDVTSL